MKFMSLQKVFTGPGLVFLALIISLPLTALAANPQLKEGIDAYENFEYEQALQILQKAVKHPGATEEETAQAHVYLGLVRFTLGDKKGSLKEFEAALKLDYHTKLPADTSPKIISQFESVKKKIKPPLEIKPDPPPDPDPPIIVKPVPPPPPRPRVWTWVATGIGGAALIGGGTFAYLASKAKSDFDNEPWADNANDLKSTVESRSLTANILLGTGAAAMVVAVILFFTEGGSAEPVNTSTSSFMLTPAGVEATIRF
ncbi:MAG: tetratricopeptide repeat protein [Deltaproteobacteria bacterium]|nr:tetratricopeptide repeat protein [Deltaproteobacteria bacterium]MBW1871895.1 tetratricopeptide repeat protein [Deltaproteobacteria bacterium]